MDLTIFEIEVYKVFILVFVRVSGLIVTAPILGSSNVPVTAKVGLAALIAFIIAPVLPAQETPVPLDTLGFAMWGLGELLIGMMMGFVMTLVFAAIQVAGQIMDMQTGFGILNVFNPALETQAPVFGFFFFILAILYLLALNGHHLMIRALVSTFDKIPLGGFYARPELLREVSTWGNAMFYDGLLIAAPVAAAMLIAYASMGLIGRVVPQIHLFVVGFPITIALGLLVVAFSTGLYLTLLDGMFSNMFRNVATVIRGMTRPL